MLGRNFHKLWYVEVSSDVHEFPRNCSLNQQQNLHLLANSYALGLL
jgi:hypothetical protein